MINFDGCVSGVLKIAGAFLGREKLEQRADSSPGVIHRAFRRLLEHVLEFGKEPVRVGFRTGE